VLGGAGVFEKIAPLVSSPNIQVSKNAVAALVKLDDPRAIPILMEAAGKAPNNVGGNDFTRAVSKIRGGVEAARACAMGEGACAQDENTRYGAVASLSRFLRMESADLKPVLHAMTDPSLRVRRAALEGATNLMRQWRDADGNFYVYLIGSDVALNHQMPDIDINPEELIVATARLMEDRDSQVRTMAAGELVTFCEGSSQLNNTQGPRFGDPDGRYPRPPVARLTPILIRHLNGTDPDLAETAARALAFLGDRRALPLLKQLDAKQTYNNNCQDCAALQALGVSPLAHSPNPSNL
jgi:HEAT repeat protein